MARKTVKKRKAHREALLLRLTVFFLMFSAIVYLTCSLFLRQYNNSLSTKKQQLDESIKTVQAENIEMEVEIAQLTSSDRVDEIAASSGMTRNQENIVTLTPEDESGD